MSPVEPDDRYFSQPRSDVAALIPREARKVLDVGCGFGALGRLLIAQRGCTVHGIERNPEASAHLNGVYGRYVIGDVEASWEAFDGERYDCIVFADVLEHLVDPWTTLARYRSLLALDGSVVASVPNVRNFILLFNLLVRGTWRYAESGLLDRTHLRFFTRKEIPALFAAAGLAIERLETNRDHYRLLQRIAAALPTLLLADLAVCQFIVRARPRPEQK
jgi:2-polyprenyl-3-methyl-5-hydroxy-6-metoxy-1,4-benzoquinol methylase